MTQYDLFRGTCFVKNVIFSARDCKLAVGKISIKIFSSRDLPK